ncbi:hypothetical protein D3C71_2094020 [compost metagenome]
MLVRMHMVAIATRSASMNKAILFIISYVFPLNSGRCSLEIIIPVISLGKSMNKTFSFCWAIARILSEAAQHGKERLCYKVLSFAANVDGA